MQKEKIKHTDIAHAGDAQKPAPGAPIHLKEEKDMSTTKYAGTQTEKNLEAAFAGESQARNKYTYFASVAKKEGYEQIAGLFLKTADNEKERYRALLNNLETAAVFEKSEVKVWECRNCGHIVVGTKAPEICPTCNHPQSYFEVHAQNY